MGGSGEGAGRFAPSPTGPLHLGSLLAATASYLDARCHGVPWRVRFDDLDEPRNVPGAEDMILRSLDGHGLHWDGPVTRQSGHRDRYAAALTVLEEQNLLFYCRCSRKQLRGLRNYPGTCRRRLTPERDSAIRVRVDEAVVAFDDLIQGPQHQALSVAGGDFVVRRRDGVIAYQLATAVDDGDASITRVIRGRDLLATTPRQIFLMSRLGASVPVYGHVPLLLNGAGQKLSKQAHARPVDDSAAAANLALVLPVLGVDPGPDAALRGAADLLAEATARFSLQRVSRIDRRMVP